MRDAIVRILRDKAGEGGEPVGGEGGTPPTKIDGNPGPDDKSKDKQPNPPSDQPPKKDGDKEYDELGYEKAPKAPDEKKPAEKKDPAAPPEKVADTTGYGDEPKVEEVDPNEKPPEVPPPPPPSDLEKRLEGLPEELKTETKELVERVQKLKLTPEQEKEWIDGAVEKAKQRFTEAKANWENNQRSAKRAQQEKEKAYYQDLKNDPDFGGEKFDVNIVRTNKVLTEFGPEIKKRFTDNKAMIHPDLMRMFARVADTVYPDRSMVQGEPPGGKDGEEEKDKPINPLDFYGLPAQ